MATETLEQEVENLLQFVYLMPVAVARLGPDGEVEMLNPKAVQLLQDLDVDVGHSDGTVILEMLRPGLAALWRASAQRVGSVVEPTRSSLLRYDGSPLHLLLHLVRPDERCTMLVIEDVSATVEQEREVGRQRRRLALALEQIQGYAVVMLDRAGLVNEWNPSLLRLFGRGEAESVGLPMLDWLARDAVDGGSGAVPPAFDTVRATVASQGWSQWQGPWRRADGRVVWGDCIVTPLIEPDGGTSGYVAVVRDYSEEHERHRQLVDDALTDPLTGLYNRRGLDKRTAVAEQTPGAGPAAWIMFDIDHFKRVNDTHGHDGGDAVLRGVAAALQAVAREGDVLARIGGEEFVLRLPTATDVIARRVAERMRLHLQSLAIEAGRHSVHITASFGVALQPPGEAWAQTLERADAALYRAKNEGRNRVVMASAEPV